MGIYPREMKHKGYAKFGGGVEDVQMVNLGGYGAKY